MIRCRQFVQELPLGDISRNVPQNTLQKSSEAIPLQAEHYRLAIQNQGYSGKQVLHNSTILVLSWYSRSLYEVSGQEVQYGFVLEYIRHLLCRIDLQDMVPLHM